MLDGLPRESHYGTAVAMDEEVAAMAAGKPRGTYRPSLTEWSPEVELLAAIFDRLGDVVKVNANQDPKYQPWPRPETALDRLRQRERERRRARIRELFYPKEGGA